MKKATTLCHLSGNTFDGIVVTARVGGFSRVATRPLGVSLGTLMVGAVLALSACGDSVPTDSARVAEKASDTRAAAANAVSDGKDAAAAAASDGKGAASSGASDVKAEATAAGAPVSGSDPVGLQAMGDRGTAILDQTAKGVASLAEGGTALLGRLGVRLRDEDARGVARKSDGKLDGKLDGDKDAAKPGAAKAGVAAPHAAKREAERVVAKSDAGKGVATTTDAAEQGLAKADGTKLDAAKRELTKADATVRELAQPDVARADIGKLDAVKREVAQADAAVRELAPPDLAKLGTAGTAAVAVTAAGVKQGVQGAQDAAAVPADAIAREALAKHRASDVEAAVGERAVAGGDAAIRDVGQPVLATIAIPFAFNASILAPVHARSLDPIVAELLRDPARHAILAGRADSRGAVGHNRTLARKRAEAVRSHLLGRGVLASQLTVRSEVGVAENVALADDSDRRVDVILR